MNKIVNSLWAGVVVSVSCFAAVRARYSLFGLNEDRGLLHKQVKNCAVDALPDPQFVTNLNGYGFGNDSLHWTWADLKKASVFVNLKLSAATLRYYYPSLIEYGQRLYNICTYGTAPLKYHYDYEPHFRYWWTPFGAVNKMFDSTTEDKFIQSWRDDIDQHIYEDVWDAAWAKNLGVLYTLQVGKDGEVMNSAMFLDTSHHKKTATEGGATGVIGDNKFPGNQLKIFFSGALSQVIANQLDTPEKFADWLLGNSSCMKSDFPAHEALKRALISDGNQISHWSKQPVWGAEKDEVSLLKKVIGEHFIQISNVAKAASKKDTGMVIKIVRRTIDFCDVVVEQQHSPRIYLVDDGYTRNGSSLFDDRSYSCTFGWLNSVPNLYLSNTSNTFYNRLTAYDGKGHAWPLGKKFRDGEIANDLVDIQMIINGTERKKSINSNEYVSWPHFQEMLQHELWCHKRLNIKFYVYYGGPDFNHYRISVNWFDT